MFSEAESESDDQMEKLGMLDRPFRCRLWDFTEGDESDVTVAIRAI